MTLSEYKDAPMASIKNKEWDPSAAFLIKCAKEKEKLRLKFQRQLQQHMLLMLDDKLFANIIIGVNGSQTVDNSQKLKQDSNYFILAHEPVLKVRTPVFLDHVKKYEETNGNLTSYQSYLCKAELNEFIKKVYTDDDIRKHEFEAIRLSKTYYEILSENKNIVNKNIPDTEEYERESVTSTGTEHYLTPKTSPVTPEKPLNLDSMFQGKQKLSKQKVSKEFVAKQKFVDNNSNLPKRDPSEGYISELDKPQEEEEELQLDISNLKRSVSAYLNLSGDASSTSVDIDESDFVLDDICSPTSGEIFLSSLGFDSTDELATDISITSGMVRSNTFDLQTQAPLEDFLDSKCEESNDSVHNTTFVHVADSSNAVYDVETRDISSASEFDNTGFYLHDKVIPLVPNIFKNQNSSINSTSGTSSENANQHLVHLRKNDRSMSDSGFMSYSAYSMLSESGLPSSASASLVMSTENNINANQEAKIRETSSQLENGNQQSGTMFPFYIDINKLPPEEKICFKEEKPTCPVYMFIDSDPHSCQSKLNSQYLNINRQDSYTHSNVQQVQLVKAQSTPHLDTCKDLTSSPCRTRPQSCYMYIDLDSVESPKTYSPKRIAKAPSSISMYVDLNDDNEENGTKNTFKHESGNFYSLLASRGFNENVKSVNNNEEAPVNLPKRKLSDSYLPPSDLDAARLKFFSLSKSSENRSDSALNHLARRTNPNEMKQQERRNYGLQNSKSMPKTTELLYMNPAYIQNKPDMSTLNQRILKDLRSFSAEKVCGDRSVIQDPVKLLEKHLNMQQHNESSLPYIDQHTAQHFEPLRKDSEFLEQGLLPMSPILRKKNPCKEQPKPVTPSVKVKASTRPQDIDAMTFPRSKDFNTNLSLQSELHDNTMHSTPIKKKYENEGKLEIEISDNGEYRIKTCEPSSRSESSLITVSGETSSDRPSAEGPKERQRSPVTFALPYDFENDGETIYSEVSDLSSSLGCTSGVASLERRWHEGYNLVKDASSHGIHNMYRMLEACSKLGEDLLHMFLEEIDTDIVILVEGKEIKAHRCILCSRCKYFASVLRGDDPMNSADLNMQGFTYSSVHFALCHIYSGAMNLPKDINLVELSILADVLSLDTLLDVIILHLKTRFCHFFHKPCVHCIQGVIECLPIVMTCGFTDLQDKCIIWLARYFTRTWSNKGFASLPQDVRELCFQSSVKRLDLDSVIEITLSCDRIITTLPHMKWAEPVFGMVTNLLQECIHFIAEKFDRILCSEGFLVLGKGHSWNVAALEDDIMSAIELMTPDVACKSCVKLNQILTLSEAGGSSEYGEFTQNFIDLLHKVCRHCERYLIHNANKVVHCQNWACLPFEVQKKIKDAAVIVFEFEKPSAKPPRLSSLHKKGKQQRDDMNQFECSTYPKPARSSKANVNDPCDSYDKPFGFQSKVDEKFDQRRDHMAKKIVSPIKEESHANYLDSKKESLDVHDEDSLKEMQDLPHDLSNAQNVFLDVSQHNSSAIFETEENHSGTHCSDNPDSLDANDDLLSDSKEDILASLPTDAPVQDKLVDVDVSNGNSREFNNEYSISSNDCLSKDPISELPSEKEEKQKSYCDIPRSQKSPVKSLVPLPKPHNNHKKESTGTASKGKDLVAEIDADSRMVTHCLQEAEMLEQQLSRKLQHQHQTSLGNKSPRFDPSHSIPTPDHRRSTRSVVVRIQKSPSSSQIKPDPTRGKSPGKQNPSLSSIQSQRTTRTSELRLATRNLPQYPKSGAPVQRQYRATESTVHNQEITVAKRITSRMRSRPVVSGVREVTSVPR